MTYGKAGMREGGFDFSVGVQVLHKDAFGKR